MAGTKEEGLDTVKSNHVLKLGVLFFFFFSLSILLNAAVIVYKIIALGR